MKILEICDFQKGTSWKSLIIELNKTDQAAMITAAMITAAINLGKQHYFHTLKILTLYRKEHKLSVHFPYLFTTQQQSVQTQLILLSYKSMLGPTC